ncbi:MAG TPA: WD40 repeat domain-containing protein [Gemmataceae bacterium]|nr:WD40 repeat domain-containing protein [Gemmataceae bacterium]
MFPVRLLGGVAVLVIAVDAAAFPRLPVVAKPRVDLYGDPLPERAITRLGSARFRHPGAGIHTVAFSGDGKLVAASGADPTLVRVWDRATGTVVADWPVRDSGPPGQMVFSPDARVLYMAVPGHRDRTWVAWELKRGDVRGVGPTGDVSYQFETLCPDGRNGIVVEHKQIIRWDLAADREAATYTRPDRMVEACVSVPDVGWVAIAHNGEAYVATRLDNGRELWSAPGSWRRFFTHRPVAASADGRQVAIRTEDGRVGVYEARTGKEIVRLKAESDRAVGALQFSPDGRTLGIEWQNQPLRLYDLPAGTERVAVPETALKAMSLAFAPDSRTFALGSVESQAIQFRDSATGRRIEPAQSAPGHTGPLVGIAFSADGTHIATRASAASDPVLIWDVASGQRLHELPTGRGTDVVYSPDGAYLAAPTRDSGFPVRLWDARTGRAVRDLGENRNPSCCLAFSRDGRRLVNGDVEIGLVEIVGRVRVWDVPTGKLISDIANIPRGADRLALCPDGREVIVATPDIEVRDVETGKRVGEPIPSPRPLTGFSLSADGRLLATADGTRTARVWELATRTAAAEIELPDAIAGIAFSPGGRTLAIASSGGTVLYDFAAGKVALRLAKGPTADAVVAFSRDGRRLATGGNSETTALVWDLADAVDRPVTKVDRVNKADLDKWWAALADPNPRAGNEAVWKLAAAPDRSVPFLADGLRRAIPDSAQLVRWIAELDDARYATRERATRELEAQGDFAMGLLRKARRRKVSAEQAERIDGLLKKLEGPGPFPERLRRSRAVAALEHVGGETVRLVLKELAAGPREAPLTRDARAALERLTIPPVPVTPIDR